MAYTPIKVANEFIARFGEGGDIDHMKLQKLLYFANGWYLGLAGQPLISENPQVWRYGPVFRWLYNAFSKFGRSRITQPVAGNPFANGEPDRLDQAGLEDIGRLIDWIWGEYGGKTGIQLSDETHAPGTPWRRLAEQSGFRVPLDTEIPPHEDYEYFSKLVAARGWTPAPFQPQS
ncbi:Panacea domain-containing protein [Qipengyuania flava]|uniref:Panacea domain-containing protein n=1 Tax=Qipengyuania flava TaxID=192812 RepID=UPI00321B9410